MQVLGVGNTTAAGIVKMLSSQGWKPVIDRVPIGKKSVAVYTSVKPFMADLDTINKVTDRTAILCSSVIRQTELSGIKPLDWSSTHPGVYLFIDIDPNKLSSLLCQPKHKAVVKLQRFVTLLINDLKSTSVLQPILEQIHLLSLSAQKTSREYTFKVLAGEQPKRPTGVPKEIDPLLLTPAALALATAVQKIQTKRLTYQNAIAQGVNDYELRYVIKGLKTMGRKFSSEIDKLFCARSATSALPLSSSSSVVDDTSATKSSLAAVNADVTVSRKRKKVTLLTSKRRQDKQKSSSLKTQRKRKEKRYATN